LNSKPHRQNSNFQLRHFLVGSCTTPDGAYVLMYGQLIDMQDKIRHAESQRKRRQAKIAKAQYTIDNPTYFKAYEVLDAEADVLEVEADMSTWDMNLAAAKQELAAIENLMLELKPRCKYAHLPILEMAEASQEDEWLGELKQRAENFLITAGTIPQDHFQTMRMHPKFNSDLVPHIQNMQNILSSVGVRDETGKLVGPADHAALMLGLESAPLLTMVKES
jgi:hypothetical protein